MPRCPENTRTEAGVSVQCRKESGHDKGPDSNLVHWALTNGEDFLWVVHVLQVASRKSP